MRTTLVGQPNIEVIKRKWVSFLGEKVAVKTKKALIR